MPKSFKFSESTLDILKLFKKVNKGMVLHSGNMLRTQDNLNKVIVYAIIDDFLPEEFAVYDLNEFIKAIELFDSPTMTLTDTHIVIKDSDQILNYSLANPEFVTEAPQRVNFPELNDEATSLKNYEEALSKFNSDIEAYPTSLDEYKKSLKSYRYQNTKHKKLIRDGKVSIEPKKPVKPSIPERPLKESLFDMTLNEEKKNSAVKLCNITTNCKGVRFVSERNSDLLCLEPVVVTPTKKLIRQRSTIKTEDITIGTCTPEIYVNFTLALDKFKILPSTKYRVGVHPAGIIEFKSESTTYYISSLVKSS
ncbi:hypothetical protein HYO43_07740 [Vibrio parahaemolyticus]|nr:hypothetical protein [Vibrio parahaemolyticus]